MSSVSADRRGGDRHRVGEPTPRDVETVDGPLPRLAAFLVGTILPIVGIALVHATPMSMGGESVGIGRLPFSAFTGGPSPAPSERSSLAALLDHLEASATPAG